MIICKSLFDTRDKRDLGPSAVMIRTSFFSRFKNISTARKSSVTSKVYIDSEQCNVRAGS